MITREPWPSFCRLDSLQAAVRNSAMQAGPFPIVANPACIGSSPTIPYGIVAVYTSEAELSIPDASTLVIL